MWWGGGGVVRGLQNNLKIKIHLVRMIYIFRIGLPGKFHLLAKICKVLVILGMAGNLLQLNYYFKFENAVSISTRPYMTHHMGFLPFYYFVFVSVKSEYKPVPTKPQNQNSAGTPSVKSSAATSLTNNKSTTSLTKPGNISSPAGSTTLGIPGSTKSALLERINANSANNINQNTLLAGHLTGAIPLKLNSGLVSTSQAQVPTTGPAILLAQSKSSSGLVPSTQGQLSTTSPALLLTQSKPGTQQPVPETQTLYLTQRQQTYSPEEWTMIDVCHFLKYNECSSYVETFHRNVSSTFCRCVIIKSTHKQNFVDIRINSFIVP